MDFAGLNYLAVGVATIAAFVFGAVYYGALSKPWMKAAGINEGEASFGPALFGITAIGLLVMAFIMAGLIGHLGEGQVTLGNGMISGILVWLGFMVTTMTINHRYQNDGWNLTLIDGGHWLGVALIMGAIIGWFGT